MSRVLLGRRARRLYPRGNLAERLRSWIPRFCHFFLYPFGFGELICEYGGGGDGQIGCKGRVKHILFSLCELSICFLCLGRLLAYCLCIGVGFIFLCIPFGFALFTSYTSFRPSRVFF